MSNFKQLLERIAALKEELRAVVIAHNYQRPEVQDIADFVGDSLELSRQCTIALAEATLSTSQMLRYVRASSHQSFIIGTEEGLLHRLRLENPEKSFYLISNSQICTDMKKTTLETVARTMELRQNVVTVPEAIRVKAKQAVDRMLAIS